MASPRKLSAYFTLSEMTFSERGARAGLANLPSDEEVANLRRLCREALEPLREAVGGPVIVLSGYRSPGVNVLVGGSKTSAHMDGLAADVRVAGMSAQRLCRLFVALGLPFDQVIQEFGAWMHVGIALEGKVGRGEVLTAYKAGNVTRYAPGILD